jgi:hypothetical protein
MYKLIASLGAGALICWLLFFVAVIYVWFQGVLCGFSHNFFLGIVSIIPPIGFLEGVAHLFGFI